MITCNQLLIGYERNWEVRVSHTICIICTGLITGYVLFSIMGAIYQKKFHNYKIISILGSMIYTLLEIFIADIRIPLINILNTLLFVIIASLILFLPERKEVLLNSVSTVIYLALMDFIVTNLCSFFVIGSASTNLLNPKFFIISGVCNALVVLCTYNVFIDLLKKCHFSKTTLVLYGYMLFLLIFEIFLLCYLAGGVESISDMPLLIVGISLVIIDLGMIFVYKKLSEYAALKNIALLMEQQRIMTIKYYEGLQERYNETQKVVHDIKKHLQVVETLKDDPNMKKDYIGNLKETISNMESQFQCKDKILCAVLFDKIQVCKKNYIKLDINIQDIEFNFMDNIEITSLFSNLLDNAIEACCRSDSEKREIKLRVHQFKEYVIINLSNTLGKLPIVQEGELLSEKPNHLGIGMKILQDLANKYYGDLSYDYSDEYFQTKLILSTNVSQ